jgi:cytidylate kinase
MWRQKESIQMTSRASLETRENFTLTISRQLGSQGFAVAQAAAERLEYRLVWRELINQAALRAGAPEAALAMIDELGLLGACASPQACLAYRQAVKQVLDELAVQGRVVILGRAGQVILHETPHTFHVRLIAPLQVRAQRVASRESIALDCAIARIEASDRNRRTYLKRFYQVNWNDPELYDLVINTANIPVDTAAALICQVLTRPVVDQGEPHSPNYGAVR